ncbi:hypothetical protein BgiBS90_024059, partial [Biomphalaria glabrata]
MTTGCLLLLKQTSIIVVSSPLLVPISDKLPSECLGSSIRHEGLQGIEETRGK